MIALPDRADWWPRLLPYLLSALSDTARLPPRRSLMRTAARPTTTDLALATPASSAVALEAYAMSAGAAAGGGAGASSSAAAADMTLTDVDCVGQVALTALSVLGSEHEREHVAAIIDRLQLGVDGDADGAWQTTELAW